jgi:hypothetical protein
MDNFWSGFWSGVVALLVVAHFSGDAAKTQCEKDHNTKQCELLWIPSSDSKGGESK